jgi:hypothetical protein
MKGLVNWTSFFLVWFCIGVLIFGGLGVHLSFTAFETLLSKLFGFVTGFGFFLLTVKK